MKTEYTENKIVFTNKARCTDCYRCLRVCPVKAIKMKEGQTYVDDRKCIECGNCIRECPQHARIYRSDVYKALEILDSESLSVVSVAPSFASVFEKWEIDRLPSALRKSGFGFVSETSVGAYYVAKETREEFNRNPENSHLCSACPVLVNYVEKYYPELVKNLVNICSPMIAHSKILRQKYGKDIKIIFVGPCVAKKDEAEREEYAGLVDCVLTFDEMMEMFKLKGINLGNLETSSFDDVPSGFAKTFPLISGLSKTGGLDSDVHSINSVSISGHSRIQEILDMLKECDKNFFVEPLFCEMGCINGPGITSEKNLFERRVRLLEYCGEEIIENNPDTYDVNLKAKYKIDKIDINRNFSDVQIKAILEKTGKYSKDDELDCGACGYPTCREKAIGVLSGMAQTEMCIPYMRKLAEQKTDKIIQTSPNGIVILDDGFSIIAMNPSFKKFFMCTDSVLGKPISYLMDPYDFEKLSQSDESLVESTVNHNRYNIICHQLLYKIKEDRQYVGIFVDVTKNISDKKQLSSLKLETLSKAQELLQHQISVAQNLAKFLGESTAKGEEIVENLIKLTDSEDARKNFTKEKWLKDIYT